MLLEIIATTLAVSLMSLVGVLLLGVNKKFLDKLTPLLVSFAIGAMLGGAFFHIIPEAFEENAGNMMFVSWLLVFGFVAFFIVEKFFQWRHCHDEQCEVHPVAYLNLIGDGVHNFIDGAVIAVSFMTSVPVGIASTIAILIHEIPQEIGDFGILVHAGMDRKKAIFYNLLTALTAVVGALIAYFFISTIPTLALYLLPLAAGGFIYIASVDLIPELHKERKLKTSAVQLLFIMAGLVLMYYIKITIGG